MSTLKVGTISNVAGTKSETTDILVDKKLGSYTNLDPSTGIAYAKNTTYRTAVDIWVVAYAVGTTNNIASAEGYTDTTEANVTNCVGAYLVAWTSTDGGRGGMLTFPVKKNDYFRLRDVTANANIYIKTIPV